MAADHIPHGPGNRAQGESRLAKDSTRRSRAEITAHSSIGGLWASPEGACFAVRQPNVPSNLSYRVSTLTSI
jgi:hypothetical protein